MAYNLLGQPGKKGERNPDPNLSDAEATYLYDTPPGFGDNKGLTKTSFGTLGPADKRTHNKKLQEVGIEPELEKGLSSLSFAEKEQPDLSLAVPNVTNAEFNNIKNEDDIAKLANEKNFTETQLKRLRGSFGKDVVNEALGPQTLQEETDFIRNRIAANKKTIIDNSPKTPSGWASLDKNSTEYKMFTTQAAVEADKIINNLGIEPTSFEAKAFKAALTYGGSDAVEKLFPSITEPVPITKFEQTTSGFTENDLLNAVNNSLDNNLSDDEENDLKDDDIVDDSKNTVVDAEDDDKTFTPNNLEAIELNNIPVGAEVWDVDGTLYLAYAVPGAGDLYTGSTIWMAYDVVGNDLFEAGLLTAGFEYKGPNGSPSKSWFDSTAVLAGNTNQLIGMDSDPFASFVETYKEEALLRPWLLDNQFIELQAEAALEDRDISEAEWRATTWYQTHSQAERDWMDIELSDPAEAQRQRDDLELYYKNQLQGLGVNNVPDGLIQWVTNKNITGTWSDLKTAEQLQLFADPYKTGERDIEMSNFIATSGFGDVDRTAAREKEVVELYRKWLGPSLGALTQEEVSTIAGRLRDDSDYEDALVNSLKQSRLAAFSNYTNPELTYEDIARPWRNLTTSVWGQNADETQGWWQEMVKSNDYSTAQTTLREKGLEQNINQVSVDASQALQNALGQGSISQTGVNV